MHIHLDFYSECIPGEGMGIGEGRVGRRGEGERGRERAREQGQRMTKEVLHSWPSVCRLSHHLAS